MRSLYKRVVSTLTNGSYTRADPQAYVHFFISMSGLAMLTALIWYFDLIDGLSAKITVNLLYTVFPLSFFPGFKCNNFDSRSVRGLNIVIVLVFLAGLLIVMSDEFGLVSLGLNVTMILVSSPFL